MTKPKTNLTAKDFPARSDANARFSLAYYRDEHAVKFLAFSPSGLQQFELAPDAYDRRFKGRFLEPLDRIILSLLRNTQKEYLPGPDSAATLLEMYEMATSEGKGLEAMDSAALTAHYNGLAVAVGRDPVKGFKSKAEAIKRIEALSSDAKKPTKKQEAAAAAKAAEEPAPAGRRTKKTATAAATEEEGTEASAAATEEEGTEASAAATEEEGTEASAAMGQTAEALKVSAAKPDKKARFPIASKKAAKKVAAKKAEPSAGGRGQGIGAFCKDLILKGKSNEEVLVAVKKQFPTACTSAASVAWYRNKLSSEGKL
jgi:chemotaxis protein histidine kinase CheA